MPSDNGAGPGPHAQSDAPAGTDSGTPTASGTQTAGALADADSRAGACALADAHADAGTCVRLVRPPSSPQPYVDVGNNVDVRNRHD
jgi:hypothetical protein